MWNIIIFDATSGVKGIWKKYLAIKINWLLWLKNPIRVEKKKQYILNLALLSGGAGNGESSSLLMPHRQKKKTHTYIYIYLLQMFSQHSARRRGAISQLKRTRRVRDYLRGVGGQQRWRQAKLRQRAPSVVDSTVNSGQVEQRSSS